MSELAMGAGLAIVVAVLVWLIWDALQSGESIGKYFIVSSRAGNPILYWLDIGITVTVAGIGALISVVAIWRGLAPLL